MKLANRLRFDLRAVLILTAIAAFVAWQYSIVLRRQAMMGIGHAFVVAKQVLGGPTPPRLNPLRELFGDESIRYIYVAEEGEGDIESLERLFPEAEIKRETPPGDW